MAERIELGAAPLPPPRRPPPSKPGRGGRQSKLDEFARRVLGPASVACGLFLLYLLWGLGSGAWSHQAMGHLASARRADQLANVALVFRLLDLSAVVAAAAFLVVCVRAEGAGYWLLGAAAFFYAGVPCLSAQGFALRHQTGSGASALALAGFGQLAWLLAVPGGLWTVVDLARRLLAAADRAAIQRANVKYGHGAQKEGTRATRHRQVFLGRCFEGPFCKDSIRAKCPIYLKRRGPCWWYKEGCMCEERIVLQAMISPDWKDQMTRADQSIKTGGPRTVLSAAAKRDRCRNCIIYNEHQREKHKALTWVTLVVVPGLLLLNFAWLQAAVNHLLLGLDAATKRFSFGADPVGITALHNGAYSIIAWVFVFSLAVVMLSQVLKLIEYWCYTLKL